MSTGGSGSTGGDGGVGGNFGDGDIVSVGACAERCVCDALNAGLSAITSALTEIDNTLQQNQQSGCDNLEDCKEEILQWVANKYDNGVKSCDECQAMLLAGLGGTLEYASACAGACAIDLQSTGECPAGSDGAICSDCGTSPCCCKQGQCVPAAQCATQGTHKYAAWCDMAGGEVIVTNFNDPPPFPNAQMVAYGDDEQVVFDEGLNICKTYQAPRNPDGPVTQPGSYIGNPACNLEVFASSSTRQGLLPEATAIQIDQGLAKALDGLEKFGLSGINFGNIGEVMFGIAQVQNRGPAWFLRESIDVVTSTLGCNSQAFKEGVKILAALGTVTKYAGIDVSGFTTTIKYVMNAECRQKFLGPSQALDAYLANAFDYQTFDTMAAIDGICPQAAGWMVTGSKAKPEPQQIIAMRHRGLIDDTQYNTMFRQLGYIDSDIPPLIFKIAEHLPDIATAVRMAAADVDDNGIASHLGLDDGLNDLMSGPIHDYIAGNGISDATIKRYWRSHWGNPSFSTLIEFYQRFRNDPDLGGGGDLYNQIQKALPGMGIPTYWQKHFMASMLTPLQKRDLRTAYTTGVMDDDGLIAGLQAVGHNDDAVTTLVKEYQLERRKTILGHVALTHWVEQYIPKSDVITQLTTAGYPQNIANQACIDTEFRFEKSTWSEAYSKGLMTREQFQEKLTNWGVTPYGAVSLAEKLSYKIVDNQAAKQYAVGQANRQEAYNDMVSDGMQDGAITRLLRNAEANLYDVLIMECVIGIKHRYLHGEISKDEAITFLGNRGIDQQRVTLLVNNFDCEKNATGKEVPAEKLCHWLYIGIIGPTEFYDRLIRLGYSEDNANRMLSDCIQANTLKAVREAKKAVKEVQAAADKSKRDKDKADAAKHRQAAATLKARKEKNRLRAARDQQLMSAAEKLYKKTVGDLATAMAFVKEGLVHSQSDYGLTVDEALKIAILAAENVPDSDLDSYRQLVIDLSADAASSGLEPSDADIGYVPSSNGDTQPS